MYSTSLAWLPVVAVAPLSVKMQFGVVYVGAVVVVVALILVAVFFVVAVVLSSGTQC